MLNLQRLLAPGHLQVMRRHVLSFMLEAMLAAMPYALVYLCLIELLSETPDHLTLIYACVGIALCFALRAVLISRNYRHSTGFGYQSGELLRLRLADKIRAVPLGDLRRFNEGDLHHKLLQDCDFTEQIFTHLYARVLAIICLSLLISTGLMVEDWRLALSMLLPVPVAIIAGVLLAGSARRQGRKLLSTSAAMSQSVLQYLGRIQLLRAFNQAGTAFGQLDQSMRDISGQAMRMERVGGRAPAAFIMLSELGIPCLLLTSAYFFLQGSLSVETAVLFLLVSQRFFRPLMLLAVFAAELNFMAQAASRIDDVLTLPELDQGDSAQVLNAPAIHFDQVSFKRQNNRILDQISFTAPAGKLTAITGPSGAGKTTVLRMLMRFWQPDSGQIRLDNMPVDHWQHEALLSQIATVFQQVSLLNDTVANNLRFGNPDLTDNELMEACKKARCHELILSLPQGYQTLLGEGGASLSGGERQRIAIAQALLKNAGIVLLDEVTSALDGENEYLIQSALAELLKQKTVIMVAHRLNTLQHADQILVMDQGRIIQQGTHQQLLAEASGLYAKLWHQQQQAQGWKVVS